MHWKVLTPLHFPLCDVRLRLWRKAAMHTWLCPHDACAKGELVHAEATSTSDLVFGIHTKNSLEPLDSLHIEWYIIYTLALHLNSAGAAVMQTKSG